VLGAGRAVALPWRDHASEARLRLRRSMWPTLQAALAAVLAWVIAHDALGHAQPFFAPIAAAIALGTTGIRRGRRIVQMVFGVTLGIGVGEGASALVGNGTWAIGIVVLATLSAAVVAGVGVFGEGMMFVNQSAASAILVVALHRHGTGSERLVDALVGGGVAGVIGVGLFPAEPLGVLRDAEQEVLRSLTGALAHVAALLAAGTPARPGWTLAAAQDIHQQLSGLAQARMTARANVRIAPRRWHLRAAVSAEDARTARLDLLASASLSLIRAATDALDASTELSPIGVDELARALGTLATGPLPWSAQTVSAVAQRVAAVVDEAPEGPLAPLVRAVGRDILLILPSGAPDLAGA
jgi:uncharacterized membrane protein YgaE (UPF0421/DUF939 family)